MRATLFNASDCRNWFDATSIAALVIACWRWFNLGLLTGSLLPYGHRHGIICPNEWSSAYIMTSREQRAGIRHAGLDAYRLLMMLMIVWHHCCVHTEFGDGRGGIWLLMVLTLPCVDSFMGLSGYFGMRLSVRRVVRFLALLVFYSFAFSSICAITGRPPAGFHLGWYGVVYMAMLFLSPVLNAALESFAASGRALRLLCLFVFLVLVQYVLNCVPGWGPYTVMNYVFVYMIVRCLVVGLPQQACSKAACGMLWACAIALSYVVAFALIRLGVITCESLSLVGRWTGYMSPVTILCAVLGLMFFSRLTMPLRIARVVSWLSPSVFSVYLIHDAYDLGRDLLVCLPVSWLRTNTALPAPVIVMSWGTCVLLSALLVDVLLRRVPLAGLARIIFCIRAVLYGRNEK